MNQPAPEAATATKPLGPSRPEVRLVVHIIPAGPEESDELLRRQMAAFRRFLARLKKVREAAMSQPCDNLVTASRKNAEEESGQ